MAIIDGTLGNDTLNGTFDPDTINGLGGNDEIDGSLGADSLDGGEGNDDILGGSGDDSLKGGEGNDDLFGGTGADTLVGGPGIDELLGGDGVDQSVYFGPRASYTVSVGLDNEGGPDSIQRGQNQYLVTDNAGGDGQDSLNGVEQLAFADGIEGQPVFVSLRSASISEGNAGAKLLNFTVNLSQAAPQAVNVQLATSDGSAVAGVDYTAKTQTLNIPAGETSGVFSVSILGDASIEAYESFNVTMSNPVGARFFGGIETRTATGTIANDDGGISASDDVAGTTASTATLPVGGFVQGNIETGPDKDFYRVTLQGGVKYVINLEGAATNGGSLEDPLLSLRNAAGTQLASDDDGGEGFNSMLAFTPQATGDYFVVADGLGSDTGTYRLSLAAPNDLPTVSIGDYSVVEGDTGGLVVRFVVSRSFVTDQDTSVFAATANGSAVAGQDFLQTSGVVTIPAGRAHATFDVPIITDTASEADESFTIALSNPTGMVLGADATATGLIINDDLATLSIGNVTQAEGNAGAGNFVFTINLSEPAAQTVSVTASTSNGTALAGSDYTAKSQAVTIPAGQSSATFTVTVNGDASIEDNESFTVTLSNPSGAQLGPQDSATGTILDDDQAGVLSIVNAQKVEGNNGASDLVFTVNLSTPAAQAVSVTASTLDGIARAGSDFAAKTQVLTIPAGQTSATFAVAVSGDAAIETLDETFSVALSNPVNAKIAAGGRIATGTILDDDGLAQGLADGGFVQGTGVADFLVGTPLSDVINGQGGANTLLGLEGGDTILGGSGGDFIVADEFFFTGNDSVEAGNGENFAFAGGGNDTLKGGAGNDLLAGENGDDLIQGGDGDNALYAGDGTDTVIGGNGGDIVFGFFGDDAIVTFGGFDLIIEEPADNGGRDFIDVGAGGSQVFAGGGDDTVFAGNGDDFILGEGGADYIVSGNGNDALIAGPGNDTLDGGGGNDVLIAEGGNDLITGGAGADTFRYPGGIAVGNDRITDFVSADDTVSLGVSLGFASPGAALAALTQNGADAVLTFAAGAGSITFAGILTSSFTAADFAIV